MVSDTKIATGYLDLAELHRQAAQDHPVYSVARAKHLRQAEYLYSIGSGWLPVTRTIAPESLRREALL